MNTFSVLGVYKVVDADRVGGSVLITFEDGEVGLFSAELLHAMLPEAAVFLARYAEDEWPSSPGGTG